MYARAINGFRGFYATLLASAAGFPKFDPIMPTSPQVPTNYEPFRETGSLVILFSFINSLFLFWGSSSLYPKLPTWHWVGAVVSKGAKPLVDGGFRQQR